VRARPIVGTTSCVLALAALIVTATIAMLGFAPPAQASSPAPSATVSASQPIPLFAYYYIWFDPASWSRAKQDYPLLGRYSSDDVAVMREQVSMAKRAGIDGFLVSWKDTAVLDHRLEALVEVSASAGFKLGIVFEGLDFHREPLPMEEVDQSFSYLVRHYASSAAFDLFGKPVVIWSGTWRYSRDEIASITRVYGSRLSILASEKRPDDYDVLARFFDGNAYYWSSGDPLHTPGYAKKLQDFSSAVHHHGGLWFAPAAPGFDATLLGGSRIIPRRDGQTLRAALNAAVASSPDAVGVISWNEFSENTAVEPSRNYGSAALQTIAAARHAEAPLVSDFDSSAPSGSVAGQSGFRLGSQQIVILATIVLILLACTSVVLLRTAGRGE
jgi:hypothetical protein